MTLRSRLPVLLLAVDWLLLLLAFIWTCKTQQNVLWWLRLDWTGWISEFRELSQLGSLPAGSVWIVWVAGSLAATAVWMLYPARSQPAPVKEASADAARKQIGTDSSMMDSDPLLKEKLLRLHQSLEKI